MQRHSGRADDPCVALVVDDDPDVRKLVQLTLQHAGMRTLEACDGEAADAVLAEFRPDVIVLDVMMPSESGIKLCQRLRESEMADIPVILLTARAQDDDVERGFEAGAVDYVTKPFSPRALARRVEAVIARSQ
jgi:two-component system response regulator MtrA